MNYLNHRSPFSSCLCVEHRQYTIEVVLVFVSLPRNFSSSSIGIRRWFPDVLTVWILPASYQLRSVFVVTPRIFEALEKVTSSFIMLLKFLGGHFFRERWGDWEYRSIIQFKLHHYLSFCNFHHFLCSLLQFSWWIFVIFCKIIGNCLFLPLNGDILVSTDYIDFLKHV